MSNGYRQPARQALIFAFVATTALAVAPLACHPSASFLGKDVTQVAAGVISFYPWIAVREALRVFGVALALTGVVGFVSALAATQLPRRLRLLAFPVAPCAAYALWFIGSIFKYPALFEGVLPDAAQRFVFHAAFVAKPRWFFEAAIVFLGLPLLGALVCRPLRIKAMASRSLAAQAAALIVLVVIVAGVEWHGKGTAGRAVAHIGGDRPNVLLIGIDSLRLDRLERPDVTPSLRQLVADPRAVLFRDHYVGVPRTFPSWLEMLQGEYSARTGIRHMFPGFSERNKTFKGLATTFKNAGYATSVYSDFAGDIFPRFEAGFDRIEAPKLTLMTMIRLSIDQSFTGFMPMMVTGPLRPLFPALKESPAFADPEHLGGRVRDQLASEQPKLTTVFFSTAHFPYAAPYPYYNMFADQRYGGQFRFQKNPELSPAKGVGGEVSQVRALYDGAVRSIDDELGRIFAELKASGAWDSTLIVVTADHGEDLYENGMLQGHGEHLRGENVLRVPLIMKLPGSGSIERHQIDFTTRSIDMAATIVDAAGVSKPVGDGQDLMPWITGGKTENPELKAYSETEIWFSRGGDGFFQKKRIDYPGISGLLSFDQGYSGEIVLNPLYAKIITAAKHRMLIDGDYKIIYMPTDHGIEWELYNRRTDPANLEDLSKSAAGAPILQRMKGELLATIKDLEGQRVKIVDDFVVPQ